MSVHRLVNVKVAEAVSALRGACAELDRSINSSHEGSFSQGRDEGRYSDENSSPGLKRRRTEDGTPTSAGDTVRELKAQLAQCQAKIFHLESQKDMQVPLLYRESVQKDQRILELTKELEAIRNEKLTAVDLRAKMEADLKTERDAGLQRQQNFQREIQQLRMRIDDIEKSRENSVREAEQICWREKQRRLKEEELVFEKERALLETRSARDEALSKLRLVEESLRHKQDELDSVQSEHRRLAEEVSQLKRTIQEHQWTSSMLEHGRELSEKMKILAQWETEQQQLRKDNQKLREDRMNVSLYQERLRILEDVEKSATKFRERCAELEFDLNVSQQLNSEWETAFRAVDPTLNSPEAVLKRIKKLQDSELCFLEENNKLKSEIAVLQSEKKQENSEETKALKLLERRLRLVRKERDSYKAVLDSYESDVTINPSSMATRRIAQLEAMLNEYRAMDAEIRSKVRQTLNGTADAEVQTEAGAPAEMDASTCDQAVEYRILHFPNNPLDTAHERWIAELKEIEKENKILRAKVKALEERGSADQPGDTTLMELVRDDPRKLRADLDAANKRMEKVLAAFKKTSREFRQAVYCLTGYRIDMKSNAQASCCVLRHVYAESPEDQLEFEIGENGLLHLLGNNYSLGLKHLTSEYLEKLDSIPAFLAALTLHLFNSQTMMLHGADQPSMFSTD